MFSVFAKAHRYSGQSIRSITASRLFSVHHVNFIPASKDAGNREDADAKGSPEKRRQYGREYYQANRERISIRHHLRRAADDTVRLHDKERYHTDEDYRDRKLKASSKCKKARYRNDSDWREREMEKTRAYKKLRSANDPQWKHRELLRSFIDQTPWAREELVWQSHKPVVFPEKTEQRCACCRHRMRRKLWWNRKAEPDQFDCNKCFMSDPSRIMPIGYEDFVFGKGSFPKRPQ